MIIRCLRRSIPLLLLGSALAAAGCRSDQPVAKKSDELKLTRVNTVAAVATEITKTSQQPATVLPFYETAIRSKVSGYVTELSADIGDFVQAGQTLALIDIPELEKQRLVIESRIDLLSAQRQGASAGVDLAEASVQSSKAKLEQAKSELGQVDASLAAAEAEFDRTQDLVERGSLQPRILDEVRKKRDSQSAAKDAVASAVQSAQADVAVAEAQKAAAAANLLTAEARTQVARRELEELDVMIGYAAVKAPYSGFITKRSVNLGDLVDGTVGKGSAPLFVLCQIDKVRIQVPVPEIDAPFVQPGDTLQVHFPSFASEGAIEMTVTRISSRLDAHTRTMIVEAEYDNAKRSLLPGMFGQASVTLDTKIAANMLPSRAVRFDESGNAYVYLLSGENKVNVTQVTTGFDSGTQIEILAGIDAGQLVIDSHLKRFSDGQLVQPL